MAFFTKFFGGGVQTAAGVAIGEATGRSLNPLTQKLTNETWSAYPDVPPDPYYLAAGVAQGQVEDGPAFTWAKENGIGSDQWQALKAIADKGPGVAMAYELRRRGRISEAQFVTALKREAIEDQWIGPLTQLLRVLLSPAELANAVVQGHRSFADALADAELQGYTQPDFQTMVDNTGLPPGVETMVAWRRRGVMNDAELDQGILESHTKPKYIPFYHAALHPVLSAAEYAGLRLRGWLTKAEADTGGALTGYTPDQMELLFLGRGRPATARQIRVGYARGARIQGFVGDVTAAIKRAVVQSDIRPEYEDIEVAASYTLPSPFVLRGLAQSGALTQAQVHTILLESGWLEEYAAATAAFWAQGTAAKTRGETKAELGEEYIAGFITETEYRAALTGLGIIGHDQDLEVLHSEIVAIRAARGAQVTKLRNAYDKGEITQAVFAGSLAALGMHDVAVQREVEYANVYRSAVGITG